MRSSRIAALTLLFGFMLARPGAPLQAAVTVTPVADAARADDLPAVRKLIKEQADVNRAANDGSTALLWAAYHSSEEMTKALLAAGATVDTANHYGVTPLLQASRNGDAPVIRALLDAGADPTRWHPRWTRFSCCFLTARSSTRWTRFRKSPR
jgi:hypothetical protein